MSTTMDFCIPTLPSHADQGCMSVHRSKRRYYGDFNNFSEELAGPDEPWRDVSIFEIDSYEPHALLPSDSALTSIAANKRKHSEVATEYDETFTEDAGFLLGEFPAMYPSVPLIEERALDPYLPNPFFEERYVRHRTLDNRKVAPLPEGGTVNGYIKFHLQRNSSEWATAMPRGLSGVLRQKGMGVHHHDRSAATAAAIVPVTPMTIKSLPSNFATGLKLDEMDKQLLRFYISAFCKGRTLLPQSNFWYNDLAPMASSNECVRHALLSFSSAYVLDYCPTEAFRRRANFHYRRATELLDQELKKPEATKPGKDDPIVGTMCLLLSNDVVNWEDRRPKGQEPLWREGSRSARLVLDHADPGYDYHSPHNVQTSNARIGNANWIAYVDICAQPVTALGTENTEKLYSWLLEGTANDVRRIHGATGVSPKLLHTFAQITHLSARLESNPSSSIVPLGAAKLEQRLERFRQWSELSVMGFDNWADLSAACVDALDSNGQVNCKARVTDLSAYAWVPAAQIYLDCRFYRKPRSHPQVRERLAILQQCVSLLPCTGELFTSQSPFFAIFIMALVSVTEYDREIARQWFDVVLSSASCRSSVPPVWDALQNIWTWMDNQLFEQEWDESRAIGDRMAWWEKVVAQIMSTEGTLSLV